MNLGKTFGLPDSAVTFQVIDVFNGHINVFVFVCIIHEEVSPYPIVLTA